ncbi:MAG: hypothetical protein R3B67_12965 [Phycisphaerales bacterium]
MIHEDKIDNISKLVPLLEKVMGAKKPLLIIAEDITGEALSTLVINKLRGTLQVWRRHAARLRRPPQADASRTSRSHRRRGS